jgi:hypothetical protein
MAHGWKANWEHFGMKDMTAEEPASELLGSLTGMALQLKSIYGTSIAVQLALRHQNAEQDSELADCLRHGVCDLTTKLFETVDTLVERLGTRPREPC